MLRLTSTDGRNFADLYYGKDVREVLKSLPDKSVHMIATSPPYLGLRDYGCEGQIGLEESPEEYVRTLVEVMREVRRVLRDDGTLWLNLADNFATNGTYINAWVGKEKNQGKTNLHTKFHGRYKDTKAFRGGEYGIKFKDLMGIPWRVAFALQSDGWYLRSDIIWQKTTPLPERAHDRPTKDHEYVFLLTKQPNYFYDYEGGREPSQTRIEENPTRNRRSVWTIPAQPYKGAHFATWPEELVGNMIKCGLSHTGCCPHCGAPWQGETPSCTCPEHEPIPCTVMDIFSGSATTGKVAWGLGRNYIGIDLNSDYLPLAQERLTGFSSASEPEDADNNPLNELW